MRILYAAVAAALFLALGAPSVNATGADGFKRCRSLSFGPGLGGYRISVKRTTCTEGRALMRRWNRADKPGPVTRLAPWTCVAEGLPESDAVDRFRCREATGRRVVATPFGGP